MVISQHHGGLDSYHDIWQCGQEMTEKMKFKLLKIILLVKLVSLVQPDQILWNMFSKMEILYVIIIEIDAKCCLKAFEILSLIIIWKSIFITMIDS